MQRRKLREAVPAGVSRHEHVDTWAVLVQLVLLLRLQVEKILHNVLATEQLGLNASHDGTRRAAYTCALNVHSVHPAANAVTGLSGGAIAGAIHSVAQSPALSLDSDGARRARRLVRPRIALRDADASARE